jgi:hypothetical protein
MRSPSTARVIRKDGALFGPVAVLAAAVALVTAHARPLPHARSGQLQEVWRSDGFLILCKHETQI